MAKRSIGFAMLVIVAVLGNLPGILADISECKGDLFAIANQCEKFVGKEGPQIPPSKECCAAMKGADLPCLCKNVPTPVEGQISMEKVIYVVRTCGFDVPPGTKCGSYTVPPPPPRSPPKA